jgi:hypothetical protein
MSGESIVAGMTKLLNDAFPETLEVWDHYEQFQFEAPLTLAILWPYGHKHKRIAGVPPAGVVENDWRMVTHLIIYDQGQDPAQTFVVGAQLLRQWVDDVEALYGRWPDLRLLGNTEKSTVKIFGDDMSIETPPPDTDVPVALFQAIITCNATEYVTA